MTPSTISGHLNYPLGPLVALEYVFMKQKCSLIDLELRDDATVKLLCSVAKEVLGREVRPHEATIDALTDVCVQTQNQFKRIFWKQSMKMDHSLCGFVNMQVWVLRTPKPVSVNTNDNVILNHPRHCL